MLKRRGFVAAFALFASVFTSCRNDMESKSQPFAITNRSEKKEPYTLILIKLKTPSLLTNITYDKRTLIVDSKDKEALLKEQEEAEAYLKSLSREIQIIYRYRFVLNGFTISIPTPLISQLKNYQWIEEIHPSEPMLRPDDLKSNSSVPKVGAETSVKFIGADRVQKELGLDGKGVKIGVIDSGIDYTHKMFGGQGTVEAYNAAKTSSDQFPNKKVVGGIDLVGSDYDDGSYKFKNRVPHPGGNPLDEGGHGTHVAGTIAGIGDGVNTYTGVAPGADLYAIRVFGREGSTSDAVVIAGLEYAVNPSGNLDPNDHLDIVNLSLGSSFGRPYRFYDEAIRNVSKAFILPVISAGNAGNVPYIVGSPSVSDETLSVAASVDNMDQNWKFRAVIFKTPTGEKIAKAVEASFGKPLESVGNLSGKLVYIGLANQDLSAEQKAALRGHVALIDRGAVPFNEKINRAMDAGAIGAVVGNDSDAEPTSMSGSGQVDIPAIMIAKNLSTQLKSLLSENKDVEIVFNTEHKIEDPSLIDTITGFSSRGPRALDSFMKPEITAPGSNILSAEVGGGDKASSKSGTSMAAPHATGCAALVKQKYPDWTTEQIKSLLMSHSIPLKEKSGYYYSLAQQGAGRVDVYKSLTAQALTISPVALALGEVEVIHKKDLRRTLTFENHSDEALTLHLSKDSLPEYVHIESPNTFIVEAHSRSELALNMTVESAWTGVKEITGFVSVLNEKNEKVASLATLIEIRRLSVLSAESLNVSASRKEDAENAPAELTLRNDGPHEGEALIFNLLGSNAISDPVEGRYANICDLESVSYRTIEKKVNSQKIKVLQFAAKLHSPLTNWQHCELSLQIDGNGDGQVDQEWIGGALHTLDNSAAQNTYKTVLTDAKIMRDLRKEADNGVKVDYSKAILDTEDLTTYEHGTLMVMNLPLSKLHVRPFGVLKVKIASLASAEAFSAPDVYLGSAKTWWTVDPFEHASAYRGMPETVQVPAYSNTRISLTHGESLGDLIVYYPFNKSSRTYVKDKQSEIVNERFVFETRR